MNIKLTTVLPLFAAVALFQIAACTGEIVSPGPKPSPITNNNTDRPCPTMIPDQDTSICPRLRNITLTCGGNGMLHTSFSGGSGNPFMLGAKLDNGSVFSAVVVVVNCQDGPREGVTLGVTYTGQVAMPSSGPPCISQSKADFSQFQFGNPVGGLFEQLAKKKMHETFDGESLNNFTDALGLPKPAASRCSFWRQMP